MVVRSDDISRGCHVTVDTARLHAWLLMDADVGASAGGLVNTTIAPMLAVLAANGRSVL